MPVLGGPAGAVRSLVATLQANLNTAIDAIWTAEGGTLTDGNIIVTVPKLYPRRIVPHARTVVTEYPVIIVSTLSGAYDPMQEPSSNDLHHKLVIEWAFRADQPQLAEEQVALYQAAIFWTIQKHKTLDGLVPGIYNTQPGEYQILAGTDKHSGKILRVGRMTATVSATENAPY